MLLLFAYVVAPGVLILLSDLWIGTHHSAERLGVFNGFLCARRPYLCGKTHYSIGSRSKTPVYGFTPSLFLAFWWAIISHWFWIYDVGPCDRVLEEHYRYQRQTPASRRQWRTLSKERENPKHKDIASALLEPILCPPWATPWIVHFIPIRVPIMHFPTISVKEVDLICSTVW